MHVRDAREGDAPALATIADAPSDVMRSHLHERTVRVAIASTEDGESTGTQSADEQLDPPSAVERTETAPVGSANDGDDSATGPDGDRSDEATDVCGFVSFDADAETVFVTKLHGSSSACRRLLDEPIAFAASESMPVEAVVPAESDTQIDALVETGFEEIGAGPRFAGGETHQFRLEEASDSTRNGSSEA